LDKCTYDSHKLIVLEPNFFGNIANKLLFLFLPF